MAERFERLYQFPNNQYAHGSPVIISAGSLLRDTITGSVVAQIKFQSVTPKTIKALKISIKPYDVAGQPIDDNVDYQYLDLNIYNGQEFGSNKAVVMKSNVTRAITISGLTVVFSDHDTWDWDAAQPFTSLPSSASLFSKFQSREMEKQYQIEVNEQAKYLPQKNSGIWCCSCGTWNVTEACTACRARMNVVFDNLDEQSLQNKAGLRLSAEKAKREAELERKRIEAEKEAEKKAEEDRKRQILIKRARIIVPIICILAICIGIFAFLYIKSKEITVERLLAFETKADIVSFVGDPKKSSGYDSFNVRFLGREYEMLAEYRDGNIIDSISLSYSIDKESEKSSAKRVVDKLISAFTEKLGEPQTFNSPANAVTYSWIYGITKVELTNNIENSKTSQSKVIGIHISYKVHSLCSHTETQEEHVETTCTTDGFDRSTCLICGYIEENVHKAPGHNHKTTITKEPTCSVVGEKVSVCSVCEESVTEEIPLLEHTYEDVISPKPTCTSDGVCKYTCTTCGDSYNENITKLGHNMSSATCTKDSTCTRCGISGEKAHGHSWNNKMVCSRCSEKYPVNIRIYSNAPYTSKIDDFTVTGMKVLSMEADGIYNGVVQVKITIEFSVVDNEKYGGSCDWRVFDSAGNKVNIPPHLGDVRYDKQTAQFWLDDGDTYRIEFYY